MVKDSLLTGTSVGTLHSKNLYRDFHLRATLRRNEESHAVISFRARAGTYGSVRVGSVNQGSIGFNADGKAEYRFDGKKGLTQPNTWFDLDLIVRGNKVTVKINGELCSEGILDGMAEDGKINLNAYKPETGVIEYRKIEIKELPPEEPRWVALFNGKTFDGWKTANNANWNVQSGAIVAETKQQSAFLETVRGDFENFHLKAKVKLQNTATPSRAAIWFRLGPDNKGYHGQFSPIKGEGGVLSFGEKPATPAPFQVMPGDGIKENTWFDYEIIADGTTVTTKVNGVQTARTSDPRFRRGRIGLEVHPNSRALFQEIEIKELPPTEPR